MKTVKRFIVPLVILVFAVWAGIKLSSNKQKIQEDASFASQEIGQVPVKIATPRMGALNQQISATGTISAFEELAVVSETQGKVEKIYKDVGDYVRKNEILVEVDDETIAANVLVTEANYDQQQKDIERMERLERGNAIAKHDLEQANIGLKKAKADLITAQKALRDTKIKTPISGFVNKKMVETGQFIAEGIPVYEIVNTSKLKLWVKIPEKDIFKIFKGQKVEVKVPAFSDKLIEGQVNAIGEKADESMKFDVEILIDNTGNGQHLKAGLYAEATIPVESSKTFLIEKIALVGSLKQPSVFVAKGKKAVKKEIVTNESNNKYVEVVKGVSQNDKIIVSGQLNLHDGDQIKIVD